MYRNNLARSHSRSVTRYWFRRVLSVSWAFRVRQVHVAAHDRGTGNAGRRRNPSWWRTDRPTVARRARRRHGVPALCAVVFVTHDQVEAMTLASRIVVMMTGTWRDHRRGDRQHHQHQQDRRPGGHRRAGAQRGVASAVISSILPRPGTWAGGWTVRMRKGTQNAPECSAA